MNLESLASTAVPWSRHIQMPLSGDLRCSRVILSS